LSETIDDLSSQNLRDARPPEAVAIADRHCLSPRRVKISEMSAGMLAKKALSPGTAYPALWRALFAEESQFAWAMIIRP
jgi:hypothetical protein